MSRTRSHILNELSITCKLHDNNSFLFIELTSKNNRSVSSKHLFIELNKLGLLAFMLITPSDTVSNVQCLKQYPFSYM